MKTVMVMLCLMLAATVAIAGVPGKTELSVVGQGVNLKDAGTAYDVKGEVLFPIAKGAVVFGPAIAFSDVDELTRFGLGLDWNLVGQKHGGIFVGGSAYWFLKDLDDTDPWTATARAGLKLPLGPGAFLKAYVEEPAGGRFKDVADTIYALGVTARF